MKSKVFLTVFLCLILISNILTACKNNEGLDPDNPTTVTLWHNYGGQMKDTMDGLIDEFNTTVGKEEGILINVTAISSSSALQEKLIMAANEEPGASKLPNITTCYPKTALTLAQNNLLVDLSTQFNEEELKKFIPDFLAEGIIDNILYVFPIAKSTEVLFVNQTLFDRFSNATGVTLETLNTFEGICDASQQYYLWSGGKTFFMPDSWFNLTQVGMEQLGDSLIVNQKLNTDSETFNKIWTTMFKPSVSGSIAISDSYSSELSKTGDIVCSTGSTAGILFYGNTITYDNNLTEEVEFSILPYPIFNNGDKIAIQRGGGMCITKSTSKEEYAAGLFLKWFSAPEQNKRFVSMTGYLPVTTEAFNDLLNNELNTIENENIKKLLSTIKTMQDEYDFYIPPNFQNYDTVQKDYESTLKELMLETREYYIDLSTSMDNNTALLQSTMNSFSVFISQNESE